MKSFKLNKKPSHIRVVREPKIRKKKWTFDRITYLAVIAAIAFVGLRFTYLSVNVIKGDGQIVFQKLSVKFTDDIRLQNILTKEGDKIMAGDTLFIYEVEDKKDDNQMLNLQKAEAKSKFSSKELEIKRDILTRAAELKGLKVMLQQQKEIYDKTVKMVLLEVQDESALNSLKLEEQKLETKIDILTTEIGQLKELKKSFQEVGNSLVAAYSPQDAIEAYISPVNGLGGQVNFENNEICYREQEVLTIHDPGRVEIQAYFSQKYMEFLKKGKLLKVKFPDGTISKGRIKQSYISTSVVPSEFQNKYEPTERNIVVSILPENENEEALWRKFYLMEVELTIFRYGVGV